MTPDYRYSNFSNKSSNGVHFATCYHLSESLGSG